MKTYNLIWLEFTYKRGKQLKEWLKRLPRPSCTCGFNDGQLEYECMKIFKARDINHAKQRVLKELKNIGNNPMDIFSVLYKNKVIFTEENI
jgi:hypothetical protein